MKASYTQSALVCLPLVAYALGATAASDRLSATPDSALDRYAAAYLGLVADLGELNPESVDFYVPDPHARVRIHATSLHAIGERSGQLARHIASTYGRSPVTGERARRLAAQLNALRWRSAQLSGEQMSFDAELARLFKLHRELLAPPADVDSTQALAQLDFILPGDGSLSSRLAAYEQRFLVSRGRLNAVVSESVDACRTQTRRMVPLPEGERITVEYVAGRPWRGYSVYRGGYHSLVQVNREMPMTVGQALNLACHEGYPGHHVYNSLRDEKFARELGWSETNALPLFSPAGFRAEAAASAAAAIVFGPDERAEIFERRLFPLAGVDPSEARRYVRVSDLVDALSDAATEVVSKYLSGMVSAEAAARELQQRALMEHPEPLLAYVDRYRAYALSYTWGRERLLAGLNDRWDVTDRSAFLTRLMTSEWDLGRQQ